MPGMPWVEVEEGRLKFPGLTRDSITIGDAAWSQWLSSPETTVFRFESEATAFTARRELRRGHAYWYAYRRRGRQLLKAYLGRSDAVDLDRLAAAAVRLSSSASPGQTPTRSVTPIPQRVEAAYISRLPAPATRLIGASAASLRQARGNRRPSLSACGS